MLSTAPREKMMTCTASVQMTASMPPRTVYNVTTTPITTMVSGKLAPVMVWNARAGRNSTRPMRPA